MHGTFVRRASQWKKSTECSIHHVPLIFDPIVGTLLYMVGDPQPVALPAKVERCPQCYPTIEALMRFCVADFAKNMRMADPDGTAKIEKLAVIWKDGRRDEYPVTK
jgi:hypothetical protein